MPIVVSVNVVKSIIPYVYGCEVISQILSNSTVSWQFDSNLQLLVSSAEL